MNIVLLGPPGSGKGTQSRFIVNRYRLNLVSLGLILHKKSLEKNSSYNLINNYIKTGNLVNNKIIYNNLKNYFLNNNSLIGYIFDGFPRNLEQAKFLKFININYVIEFVIPDRVLIKRLLGRRIHLKSGRIYHLKYNPPKVKDLDDITGEKLVFRKDDNLRVINNRLKIYKDELFKLKNFFKIYNFKKNNGYYIIDACKNINDIYTNIISIIG